MILVLVAAVKNSNNAMAKNKSASKKGKRQVTKKEEEKPSGFSYKFKYKTDKFETGLMHYYMQHFQGMRNRPVRMLEIGIGLAGSTNFFADYFDHPQSQIIAIDIRVPVVKVRKNVKMINCNQNDTAKLQRIARAHGPFDIIIDDGSHRMVETKKSFDTLYPHVKPGGYYVIEDFMAQYLGQEFKGMLPYVLDLGQRAVSLNMYEFTIHSGFRCSTAIFRKNLSKPKVRQKK